MKVGLHPRKMLCIWWHWQEVLYYELLSENQTINSNRHCFQLVQLKTHLNENQLELVNRKCIVFHCFIYLFLFYWMLYKKSKHTHSAPPPGREGFTLLVLIPSR